MDPYVEGKFMIKKEIIRAPLIQYWIFVKHQSWVHYCIEYLFHEKDRKKGSDLDCEEHYRFWKTQGTL